MLFRSTEAATPRLPQAMPLSNLINADPDLPEGGAPERIGKYAVKAKIAEALFIGLEQAVKKMKALLTGIHS